MSDNPISVTDPTGLLDGDQTIIDGPGIGTLYFYGGDAPDWKKEGYSSAMDRALAHANSGGGGGGGSEQIGVE